MRTIWLGQDGRTVEIIDQTRLPHELVIIGLRTLADAVRAIGTMQVRGAPLIGATAAYGVALWIMRISEAGSRPRYRGSRQPARPRSTRWALAEMRRTLIDVPEECRLAAALARAGEIAEAVSRSTRHRRAWRGLIAEPGGEGAGARVDVLTHCNAGWLATVDWGTARPDLSRA
jgi:methylthioribose-1-phosphate isomerase